MSVPQVLAKILERRERESQSIRPSRVTGRALDGALFLAALDGACEVRGPVASGEIGEIIRLPESDCTSSGASGVALLVGEGAQPFQWIERLEPNLFEAGQTYEVEAIGLGLTETLELEFLKPGIGNLSGELNPDLTIIDLTHVSGRLLTFTLEVAPGAEEVTDGDLAYGEPSGEPIP